jgi:heme-degrading monooxygenase HmoA
MIAVIFEVEPHPTQKQNYLDIAAELKPILEKIDGFISVERFQSLSDQNKILSLSFFRDEEAVLEWRNIQKHRRAQSSGREQVFENYRLRVASVVRDYGMFDRNEAPSDSLDLHG